MHLTGFSLAHERYPTRDHFPFNLPLLHITREVGLTAPVTFFVGENGSGKSTLLEAVTRACGIHIWRGEDRSRCTTNLYERDLYRCVDVHWREGAVVGAFWGSSTFRHFAKLVDEWAAADPGVLKHYGNSSLLTKSHGQSIMAYFESRFHLEGVYFLDEPETALSPRTQMRFLDILKTQSARGQAQFVIATHSPILLSCPGALIYDFDQKPLRKVTYDQTEQYRVYREFFMKDTKPE